MRLNRAINNLQRHLRNLHLRHCNLLDRKLRVLLIDLYRRIQHHQTARVDLNARFGDPFEQHAVLGEGFAERDLARVVEAVDQPFKGAFCGADGAHGVVDAAGAEAALHDFVATAFA